MSEELSILMAPRTSPSSSLIEARFAIASGFSEVPPAAARDRSCREDDNASGCEDGHLATLISDA